MNDHLDQIKAPLFKGLTAGATVISLDWLNTAGKVAGSLYALALLGEWLWKRVVKPICLTRGWIKPKTVWTPFDGE